MYQGKEHILIVDDDARVRRLLERYMLRNGYHVTSVESGQEMREALLAKQGFGLILLDLMMPDEDGITLARAIRCGSSDISNVPIIMLTGRADTVDKVVGLEVGADDYMTKPFDERELLARVRSVMRRKRTSQSVAGRVNAAMASESPKLVEFGQWRLDIEGYQLIGQNGECVHLTRHEFILLEAFLKRPNRIWCRDEILDLVSGREWQSTDRSIDVLVAKLRKKIEADPKNPEYIQTVRGVGYRFFVGLKH